MFDKLTLKLYIEKKPITEWLTLYMFVFPLIMAFLTAFLHLPGFVKYISDLAWVTVTVSIFFRKRAQLPVGLKYFINFILFFLLYTFIIYIFKFQSPFYYLWGVRNNFRFYFAFIAYAVIISKERAHSCLKLLDSVFWINAVVTLVQFFILGHSQDHLGGIFGVEKGCNSYSIIFFSIIISKSLLQFMNGEEKTLPCFSKCAVALIIAAMAEIKFFFIIFILILVICAFLTKFSIRKFSVLLVSAFLVMVGGTLLTAIFGSNDSIELSRIFELFTSSNYATAEDLGRFTAIPTISNNFLTTIPSKLVGMGLGNCDTSAFAICNTPFYQTYQYLHYNWFFSAFLFLETGYIGLIAYLSFFVAVFFNAKRNKRLGLSDELFCSISMIMSVVCAILTFYNASSRTEIAYLAFFALALPFIGKTQQQTDV